MIKIILFGVLIIVALALICIVFIVAFNYYQHYFHTRKIADTEYDTIIKCHNMKEFTQNLREWMDENSAENFQCRLRTPYDPTHDCAVVVWWDANDTDRYAVGLMSTTYLWLQNVEDETVRWFILSPLTWIQFSIKLASYAGYLANANQEQD